MASHKIGGVVADLLSEWHILSDGSDKKCGKTLATNGLELTFTGKFVFSPHHLTSVSLISFYTDI